MFFTAPEKDFVVKILNSFRFGFLAVNLDQKLSAINEIAMRILGLEIQDYIGWPIDKLFMQQPQLLQILMDACQKKTLPSRAEMVLRVSGDKDRTVGYTISSIKDEQGKVEGVSLCFKDLTKIEQLNEQEKLKDRLAALGQMAAGLAHEIRNPLAAIELTTSLIKRKLTDQPTQVSQLESIHSEVRKLNKIVTDCLEFVRPVKVSTEKIDLAALLEESVSSAVSTVHWENCRIEKDFNPTPPVQLDRHQMKQVFVNIIMNALQAIRENGIIKVSCGPSAQFQKIWMYSNRKYAEKNLSLQVNLTAFAWVKISDNGSGIPEEVLSKIFYPFFTTKEKGSGIGLAIAQKIIDSHRGNIDVESEVGKGTTFTIKLPLE
jgi:signal transduction histidine kinase